MIGNRTPNDWFAEYGKSHKNRTNKAIHWVCVPVIFLSIIGLLWDIPVPTAIEQTLSWFNWGHAAVAFSIIFYLKFSLQLAIGLTAFCATCVALLTIYDGSTLAESFPTWAFSLTLFLVAWVFQFVGHKIEGAKPSFFKDLVFLMVGPAFFMAVIYRRLGFSY